MAVSRLMLDNFPHIKAYWIMLGIGTAQVGAGLRGRRHRRHGPPRADLPRRRRDDARDPLGRRNPPPDRRSRPRAGRARHALPPRRPRRHPLASGCGDHGRGVTICHWWILFTFAFLATQRQDVVSAEKVLIDQSPLGSRKIRRRKHAARTVAESRMQEGVVEAIRDSVRDVPSGPDGIGRSRLFTRRPKSYEGEKLASPPVQFDTYSGGNLPGTRSLYRKASRSSTTDCSHTDSNWTMAWFSKERFPISTRTSP